MIGAAAARTGEARHETARETPVVEFDQTTKRFYPKKPAILYGGRLSDAARSVAGTTYDFFKLKRVADDHLLLRDEAGASVLREGGGGQRDGGGEQGGDERSTNHAGHRGKLLLIRR